MSGELVHKLRVVRCPKCKLLLAENPEYDVYECGECGTKLKAKKRKGVAVNSESSAQETEAASRNALDLVTRDKKCGNRKLLDPAQEDGPKAEATSSFSGECYLDGNLGRVQNENGECVGDKLPPFNLSDEEQEIELDIYKLSHRRHRLSNKCCSNKTTQCEIEEINSGNLLSEGPKEEFICASDENHNKEKSTLVGVMSEMEITRSDLDVAEDLNIGTLLLKGAEEKLTSRCDGEYANDNKSALRGAEELNNGNLWVEGGGGELTSGSAGEHDNKDRSATVDVKSVVEIAGSDLEGAEVLDNENLPVQEAEKWSNSGSDGEGANKDKSAPAGASPEVEITKSDLEGAEESNNGNLLLKGVEEELISGLDGEDANNDKLALGENLEVEITGSTIAEEELNNGKLLQGGAKEELNICLPDGEDPNSDQTALVGAKSEVDITESTSTTKSSSAENFVSEKESTFHVTPDKVEQGASGNPASSHKLQKQAQKSIRRSFEHVRSVDRTDTPNHSSELSGTLGGFSKSPTTRSSYAYDGSLSSYNGMGERFPIQQLDSFGNTHTFADSVSEEMTRKGKGRVSSVVYGDLGTQHQSYLPNGKHHVKKDSRGNQNKVVETTRHGHHQHWMRTKRDELPPRMPFRRSGSQSRYESSSSSNQMHDEPYYRSSFLSHDSSEQGYQEKMKLLRMIYKLQDQLNRTRYASRETNGRQSTGVSHKGKHISPYHGHSLHERRFSHGLDYPMCNGRCSHELNRRQRPKFSQIPYPDEATSSAQHGDQSCSHCYPKEWRFSADFSPRSLFHNEELCRSCLGQDCFTSHHSYPSSPQMFTPSKLRVYGHETKSDDQKRRARDVRTYLREKQHLVKQNYRPVAGGAPFVTCHKCLNLLRLPADFLLSKRGPHQLRCGECSEVLKFSLRNGSLVFYPSNASGPPSSGLNDQTKVAHDSADISSQHIWDIVTRSGGTVTTKISTLLMGYSSPSQVIRGVNSQSRAIILNKNQTVW